MSVSIKLSGGVAGYAAGYAVDDSDVSFPYGGGRLREATKWKACVKRCQGRWADVMSMDTLLHQNACVGLGTRAVVFTSQCQEGS